MLIYNPVAGRLQKRSDAVLSRVLGILRAQGHSVRSLATTGPRTANGLARAAVNGGADLIVGLGGDGTLNEIAEGITPSKTPLAALPGGTANVLLNELGLGNRVEEVARHVADLVPERISTGLVTTREGSRRFLLMLGAGLDAQIVYQLNPRLKSRFGKLAYWLAGSQQTYRRLKQFTIRLNGHSETCSFALASRVSNYGGDLEIARRISLLDGEFEVVLFRGRLAFCYVKYLVGVLTHTHYGMSGISVEKAQRLELDPLEGARIHMQVDGEYLGCMPAAIELVPDSLTLLIPEAYRRKAATRR